MKVSDLITRLSKFADLDLMLVSKKGNTKGYNLDGVELSVHDSVTDKLDSPENITSSKDRRLVVVLFGNKLN